MLLWLNIVLSALHMWHFLQTIKEDSFIIPLRYCLGMSVYTSYFFDINVSNGKILSPPPEFQYVQPLRNTLAALIRCSYSN